MLRWYSMFGLGFEVDLSFELLHRTFLVACSQTPAATTIPLSSIAATLICALNARIATFATPQPDHMAHVQKPCALLEAVELSHHGSQNSQRGPSGSCSQAAGSLGATCPLNGGNFRSVRSVFTDEFSGEVDRMADWKILPFRMSKHRLKSRPRHLLQL